MKRSRVVAKLVAVVALVGAIASGCLHLNADRSVPTQGIHPVTSDRGSVADPQALDAARGAALRRLLGKLPLYFIENRGQEDPQVAYYLQGGTPPSTSPAPASPSPSQVRGWMAR
mgnify:CR=1 FL=1